MNIEVRPITEDEVEAFRVEMVSTFGGDLTAEERADHERFRDLVPLARTRAAFDGGELVATLGDFPLDLTVPGGEFVPMAGTTMVSVRPSHTRRGLLRAMMSSHLDAARGEGRPLAGLWASETGIYGRFGFGAATDRIAMKLPAGAAALTNAAGLGSVRQVSVAEARELLPPVYERVRAGTPGVLSRSDVWWKWFFYDPESWRRGKSARRLVAYEGPAGVDGYATYRVEERWRGSLPAGKVSVEELVAATPEAHDGLWRYLTSVDLFPRVSYWNLPVDDALRWQVASPRALRLPVEDGLWLRVLDVPRALSLRRYGISGTLRLAVEDALFPESSGTYELVGGPTHSSCRRIDAEGHLMLGVATLGMLYLGGRRAAVLARAGLLDGPQEAVALADAMFAGAGAPWCPEIF